MKSIKTSVLLIIALVLQMSLTAFATTPEQLSYQAVIKDASNNLVVSHAIGLKISILQTTSTGAVVYSETHTPNSNSSGLVSVAIGTGTVVSGTFAGIDWSTGTYFIKSEIDPAGGTSYTVSGTTQLQSVPYALHAKTVDGAFSGSYNDLSEKPSLTNGTVTSVSGTSPISVAAGTTTPAISISAATTSAAGSMSALDKTKLDGIAASANNYTHPTGDGNLHVPTTSTINSGKVLTAGATAGSLSWNALTSSQWTTAGSNIYYNTGNVGIGTDAPGAKLHIAGADMNNALLFENTSANPGHNYILFKTQGTEQGYIGLGGGATNHMSVAAYGASNNLYLETNSQARMTILPSGNVGIGTTTPGYKLHVSGGTIRCELGSNGVSAAFLGGGSNLQVYHNSGSSVYFWNTAGGVYEFYNGAGSTSTGTLIAGAFNTGSDRRLKNNIVNTHFGINDLMKIQVRDYVYKADAGNTLTTGFIAQELFEIFPNAVTKPANDDDMWSVDYGKVTPLLVKAIQDLKKTNDTQKLTNDAQQKQINAQQTQIDVLTKLVESMVKK